MSDKITYYDILGITPDASDNEISTAYAELRGEGRSSAANIIEKAYAVLSNDESRAEYDWRLRQAEDIEALTNRAEKAEERASRFSEELETLQKKADRAAEKKSGVITSRLWPISSAVCLLLCVIVLFGMRSSFEKKSSAAYEEGYNSGVFVGYNDGVSSAAEDYTEKYLGSYKEGYASGFADGAAISASSDNTRAVLQTAPAFDEGTADAPVSDGAISAEDFFGTAGTEPGESVGSASSRELPPASGDASYEEKAVSSTETPDVPDAASGQKTPTSSQSDSRTVYVSKSGKIHFKSDCSGMKNYTEMTYAEAIAAGYSLCSKCTG